MSGSRVLNRFDHTARRVVEEARDEATNLGDEAVGTEHLLIALAGSDSTTAGLLTDVGVAATDLRRTFVGPRDVGRRHDHESLLSTLGVDLAEIRTRAMRTFGLDALERAADRTSLPRPRRPLHTWISCSRPLPRPRCESPLAGRRPEPIPRVTRLLKRVARAARRERAGASHLLLALIEGNEPASELLARRGVDLQALAETVRHATESRPKAI